MTPNEQSPRSYQIIAIDRVHCWSAHRRFQDLSIQSFISTGEPLKVEISDPQTAVQVWSVIKQVTETRSELVEWLEHCWQMPHRSHKL